MKLRNRRGTAVDPVPFLVVAAMAFLVSFSYGPIYCHAVGLRGAAVLGVPAGAFLVACGVAYHRLVWTARPDLRGEVPAERRLARLFYAALAGILVLVGLTLPLLVS
ncbi:MAG: hypothetical protein ABEJ78_10030 [Haloferacaceae archaeon]